MRVQVTAIWRTYLQQTKREEEREVQVALRPGRVLAW